MSLLFNETGFIYPFLPGEGQAVRYLCCFRGVMETILDEWDVGEWIAVQAGEGMEQVVEMIRGDYWKYKTAFDHYHELRKPHIHFRNRVFSDN